MAESQAVGRRPSVILTARERSRIAWPLVGGLLPWAALLAISVRLNDWFFVFYFVLYFCVFVIVMPLGRRWRMSHRSTPDHLLGYLVVPKVSWWRDKRCTAMLNAGSVWITRNRDGEAWNVPWAKVDQVTVTRGRNATLTLIVGGAPLAEIRSVIHSDRLSSYLQAAGLPPQI